jgi:hypothetical protein
VDAPADELDEDTGGPGGGMYSAGYATAVHQLTKVEGDFLVLAWPTSCSLLWFICICIYMS